MYTGVKKLRAAFIIGALSFSLYSPVIHAENGNIAFGAAAVTGAVSAMVVPAIMAGANVDIARINAGVATYLADLNAATQVAGINASAEQAKLNTLTTLRIASIKSQAELTQTYMMTAFKAWDRNLGFQMQQQQMAWDNYMANRRLDFEAWQARLNNELQIAEFNRSLVEKGLAGGFTSVSSLASRTVPITPASIASAPSSTTSGFDNGALLRGFQSKAKGYSKAFRGITSLAAGSTPTRKNKSELAEFMEFNAYKGQARAASKANHFPLHRSNDLSSIQGGTHEGSYRALRSRSQAQ